MNQRLLSYPVWVTENGKIIKKKKKKEVKRGSSQFKVRKQIIAFEVFQKVADYLNRNSESSCR